eukprot:15434727-Alexandrium_andersonii.AAC.1
MSSSFATRQCRLSLPVGPLGVVHCHDRFCAALCAPHGPNAANTGMDGAELSLQSGPSYSTLRAVSLCCASVHGLAWSAAG